MRCPSCKTALSKAVALCPRCDFELRKGDRKFGPIPRHSRYVTDHTGKLPGDEVAKLRARLNLFRKKFPQSLFSVFVTELSSGVSVGEYAFWLANRVRSSSIEAVGAENFDLLLVIDLAAGTAAFTIGYGLEKYLGESDLENTLSQAKTKFRQGDLTGGITLCIEGTEERMREAAVFCEDQSTFENTTSEVAALAKA